MKRWSANKRVVSTMKTEEELKVSIETLPDATLNTLTTSILSK